MRKEIGEGQAICDDRSGGADTESGGPLHDDALMALAPAQTSLAGQDANDAQSLRASQSVKGLQGRQTSDRLVTAAAQSLALTIAQIRAMHRERCFAMEMRKRQNLALGSHLRSALGWSLALPDEDRKRINDQAAALMELGEAEAKAIKKGKPFEIDEPEYHEHREVILATIAGRKAFDDIEDKNTKLMEKLAKGLPVYSFAEEIRGFGARSLATIIAECGDLSNYANPGKVWKRLGLARITKDGVTRSGCMWAKKGGLGKDDWIAAGYSRKRRSRMWTIGDTLNKCNRDGEYRSLYLARKDYLRIRAQAAGLTVSPAAKIPKGREDEFVSDMEIHRQAQQYMEKRLIRELWRAWGRAIIAMSPMPAVPAPTNDSVEEPAEL